MNRLAAILPVPLVQVDVEATSKKRLFEEVGLLFENQASYALSRATVTDSLFARERLGSTGLGHGVAIPHGRIKGLKNPQAAVLRVITGKQLGSWMREGDAPAHHALSYRTFSRTLGAYAPG